jgi:hypothetical protein
VIDSYEWRAKDDHNMNHLIKSIVDPRRAERVCGGVNSHCFDYGEGHAVDELFRPMDRKPRSQTESVSFARLRINHYYMKSRAQWFAKQEVPSPQNGRVRTGIWPSYERLAAALSAVHDETIKAYVPAVKDALAVRAGSTPTAP